MSEEDDPGMGRDLGKWPRLMVAGDPVTEEQANEILIRTNDPDPFTNDREWRAVVNDAFGITRNLMGGGIEGWQEYEARRERLGILWLEYLQNSMIANASIDGRGLGWCDWDGRIGGEHNIGKWPSMAEVHDEWTRIADAFPYLRLRAQLLPDAYKGFSLPEGAEPWEAPTRQWLVEEGRVTLTDDESLLVEEPPESADTVALRFLATMDTPGRERFVSEERLRAAIRQVEASVAS